METKDIIEFIVSGLFDCLKEDILEFMEKTESPIEKLFIARFLDFILCQGYGCMISRGSDENLLEINIPGEKESLFLETQKPVGKYRADFMFYFETGQKLVVECDGHAFHEKTKHQAKKDRARDRFFTSQDIPVFRYTGSEIFNDTFSEIAIEVLNYLNNLIKE